MHRLEHERFTTGRGRYVDDVALPGQCHLRPVRSPYAHARIRSIDARAALAVPGVLIVLTAEHMLADNIGDIACHFYPEDIYPAPPSRRIKRSVLARDVVRHIGDRVAIVVADTAHGARDAAELVEVDYDPMPSVATVDAALELDAPQLWPEAPGNVLFRYSLGDKRATDEVLRKAQQIVSLDVSNQRIMAFPLEQSGAIGEYDPQGGYILHTSAS